MDNYTVPNCERKLNKELIVQERDATMMKRINVAGYKQNENRTMNNYFNITNNRGFYFLFFTFFFLLFAPKLFAQKENVLISQGNQLYKQKKFDQSQKEYEKAVSQAPANSTANYNLGNAQFRKNNFNDASKSYNTSVEHTTDKPVQQKAYYNKGVALIKQQKTDESIDAWKNALKLDPNDEDARENLEKALLEKKSKQPKDQKNNQQQNKQNQQQPKQQPPPHSKLNKQQVDQLLKALQQRENEAQEKMNQNKTKSLSQPDKDW